MSLRCSIFYVIMRCGHSGSWKKTNYVWKYLSLDPSETWKNLKVEEWIRVGTNFMAFNDDKFFKSDAASQLKAAACACDDYHWNLAQSGPTG